MGETSERDEVRGRAFSVGDVFVYAAVDDDAQTRDASDDPWSDAFRERKFRLDCVLDPDREFSIEERTRMEVERRLERLVVTRPARRARRNHRSTSRATRRHGANARDGLMRCNDVTTTLLLTSPSSRVVARRASVPRRSLRRDA